MSAPQMPLGLQAVVTLSVAWCQVYTSAPMALRVQPVGTSWKDSNGRKEGRKGNLLGSECSLGISLDYAGVKNRVQHQK